MRTSVVQSRTSQARAWRTIKNILYGLAVAALVIFYLLPFLWMVLNSFKTPLQVIKLPPDIIFTPTLDNYKNVFFFQDFTKFLLNSVIVATGSTFFGLVLGLPAAYAIARFNLKKTAVVILMSRMVPGITFLLPLFIMFRQFELVDTYTSLVLAHMLVGLPFIIWVMVPFFEGLPRELQEAAIMDGASTVQTFNQVLLPLSVPGIVTCSILSFVFSWNNFMFSIVLATSKTKTVPVAIFNFISYAQIDWGGLMAAAVVITLPVLVLAIATQRYVIRGLTAGAVKG